MRHRKRNSLKLILFLLLISISLGYAFLQTDLTINGTSKITATSWDIHFNNVQITTGSVSLSTGDSIPTIDTTTGTDITYIVTLTNPGDFYEFTVDVVNFGTLDGMIDTISSKMNGTTISTLPNYMNYSVTYSNDMPIKEKHLLASGVTDTLKVRIEFRTDIDPSDLPNTLQTNTFAFGLSYVQADENAVTRPTQPIIKRVDSYTDSTAFRSSTYRDKIKTITLGEEISPPENVVESWDIGQDQNGNVMAYVTVNADDNTMYDLYIQGDGKLYANPDSQYLFYNLRKLSVINNMEALNTSKVTSMKVMFLQAGYESTDFTLDLGDNFDTSNVTDMSGMFKNTGYSSAIFTLDLGDKFDTSNVMYMAEMFSKTGYSSTVMTLDLGSKFDTSKVTDMSFMFNLTAYSSPVFTLNLGDKFDTSKVTEMNAMFQTAGRSSTMFTLDLGSKFDTSKVTKMGFMFANIGYTSTVFTLDLGNKFDTSRVTDMSGMFSSAGHDSPIFTLNLGDKFDTSRVTNMSSMFYNIGCNNTRFTLNLGNKFNTSNVTNMKDMFYRAGYRSSIFTLDLGDKFYTSSVTNMRWMFYQTGYTNHYLELDLSTFDFGAVTDCTSIFSDFRTTGKIWVGNATAQSWIINNSGNSNLTASNVLIKT